MMNSMFSVLSFTYFVRLGLAASVYQLQDSYIPSNFFDKFNFFDGPDPTEGFVKLVDRDTAQSSGLMSASSDSVKFGVDTSNVTPGGRPSIRLESKQSYNYGLIIADLAHMPGSICGAWPAFWTIGPDWPSNGEIDIIEGVNSQKTNAMTLHTSPGCSISTSAKMAGKVATSDCDINAPDQGTNVGCGIKSTDTTTYGDGFNAAGGGVYATEWTAEAISVYHFSKDNIPADIASGTPDPTSWGLPLAQFSGCNFPNAIRNQTIVFDTTFCGQWAGEQSVWDSDAVCSSKAATCEAYVENNPSAFTEAFWQVNSVKVYQLGDGFIGSSPIPSSSAAPSTSAASSAVPTTFETSSIPAIPTSDISTSAFPTSDFSVSAVPTSALPTSVITSAPIDDSSLGALTTSYTMVTLDMTTTTTVDGPSETDAPSSSVAPMETVAPTETTAPAAPVACDESHKDGCISRTRGPYTGRFSYSRWARPSKRSLHGHENAHLRRHAHGHAHAHI